MAGGGGGSGGDVSPCVLAARVAACLAAVGDADGASGAESAMAGIGGLDDDGPGGGGAEEGRAITHATRTPASATETSTRLPRVGFVAGASLKSFMKSPVQGGVGGGEAGRRDTTTARTPATYFLSFRLFVNTRRSSAPARPSRRSPAPQTADSESITRCTSP
jgi:hypothetical protein